MTSTGPNNRIEYTTWSVFRHETDRLHRLVDLRRAFRGTETRRHVREETPFYTGETTDVPALLNALP